MHQNKCIPKRLDGRHRRFCSLNCQSSLQLTFLALLLFLTLGGSLFGLVGRTNLTEARYLPTKRRDNEQLTNLLSPIRGNVKVIEPGIAIIDYRAALRPFSGAEMSDFDGSNYLPPSGHAKERKNFGPSNIYSIYDE